jgi:hypothetical protein
VVKILLRSFHLKDILRAAVKILSQTSDCPDPIRPDDPFGEQIVLYMDDDFIVKDKQTGRCVYTCLFKKPMISAWAIQYWH